MHEAQNSTTRSAVILGNEAFLRARHEEGNLVTPQDDRGSLLRLAVDWNQADVLRLLLDLALDPDARACVEGVENVEFTWGMPLYECVRSVTLAMAEWLLERGRIRMVRCSPVARPLSEVYAQRDERMIALLERYGGKSNASMAGLYRRRILPSDYSRSTATRDCPMTGLDRAPSQSNCWEERRGAATPKS